MEVLNRDTQFVSPFKNHQQIEYLGLITLVGRHYILLHSKEKSYSSVDLSLRPRIHSQLLERQTYIIQALPGLVFFPLLIYKGHRKFANCEFST